MRPGQGVASRLMAQHLAACLQAAGASRTPAAVLRGGPALWARARRAALAQELAMFRQAGGKAPYLRAAACTSACASFLPPAAAQDGAAAAVAGAAGGDAAPGSAAMRAGAWAPGEAPQAAESGPSRTQRARSAEAGCDGGAPARHVCSGPGDGEGGRSPGWDGALERPAEALERPAKRPRAGGPQSQGCQPPGGAAASAQACGVLEDAEIAWDAAAPASNGSGGAHRESGHADPASDRAEGAAGSSAGAGCPSGGRALDPQATAGAGKALPLGPRTPVGGRALGTRPLSGAAAEAASAPAQPAAAQRRRTLNPESGAGGARSRDGAAAAVVGGSTEGVKAGQPAGTGRVPAQSAAAGAAVSAVPRAAVTGQLAGRRAPDGEALPAHRPGEGGQRRSGCVQVLGGLHAEARKRREAEGGQAAGALAAAAPEAAAGAVAGAPAQACVHLPAIRRFVRALLDPLYDAQVLMPAPLLDVLHRLVRLRGQVSVKALHAALSPQKACVTYSAMHA